MSFLSTYQSRKTLLAGKLNNKGVTDASASDGLTTLIEYIDDIPSGGLTNGIFLAADKSIDQSSNTINFTAVYLTNGNVVSGKSINFYGLKESTSTSKSLTADTWTPVGCKFGVSAASGTTGILYLTQDSSSVTIVAASGNLIVNIPNKSPYSGVSNIVFEDGILSFTQNGSTVTEDLSSYDCTNVNATVSGFTIADYGVFDTTDSNGVATATYTCSGVGKFNVQAISGNLQSTPYPVTDGKWYDEASSTTHKSDYTKTPNDIQISYDGDCTVLANTSSTEYKYQANYSGLGSLSDCTIELDVNIASSSVNNPQMYLKGWTPYFSSQVFGRDNWVHIKFVLENGTGKCYVDGTETVVTGSYTTSNGYLQFRYTNTTLKFKNLVVY